MFRRRLLVPALAVAVLGMPEGAAHADMVSSLGTIAAPATVAFANSNVQSGTVNGPYNFLDRWNFTLSPAASLSTLAAAISFSAPFAPFGVSALQLNLIQNPPSGAPVVSWSSVTTPAPGVSQVIAFVTPTALGAGAYTLEVRGTLGNPPGSYSGSLIASPVPLPAVLPLWTAGLAALAGLARRRRAGPALAQSTPA